MRALLQSAPSPALACLREFAGSEMGKNGANCLLKSKSFATSILAGRPYLFFAVKAGRPS